MRMEEKKRRMNIIPVSYTHLDVYKRQVLYVMALFAQR